MPGRQKQMFAIYDPKYDDAYSIITFIHSNIMKTESIKTQSLLSGSHSLLRSSHQYIIMVYYVSLKVHTQNNLWKHILGVSVTLTEALAVVLLLNFTLISTKNMPVLINVEKSKTETSFILTKVISLALDICAI